MTNIEKREKKKELVLKLVLKTCLLQAFKVIKKISSKYHLTEQKKYHPIREKPQEMVSKQISNGSNSTAERSKNNRRKKKLTPQSFIRTFVLQEKLNKDDKPMKKAYTVSSGFVWIVCFIKRHTTFFSGVSLLS